MDSEKKRWQARVTAAVFCVLIFGFTAATIFTPTVEFSETENRVLAGVPEVKINEIFNGDFEADYEEYLTDQFILRNGWISLKTSAERLLGKRESKDIYFAEDDYLIEKHTGAFTTQIAERNITALADFVEKYKAQFGEGHMSVLIVPNAVDILPDKLPRLLNLAVEVIIWNKLQKVCLITYGLTVRRFCVSIQRTKGIPRKKFITGQITIGKPLLPFMCIRRGRCVRDMLYRSLQIMKFKR